MNLLVDQAGSRQAARQPGGQIARQPGSQAALPDSHQAITQQSANQLGQPRRQPARHVNHVFLLFIIAYEHLGSAGLDLLRPAIALPLPCHCLALALPLPCHAPPRPAFPRPACWSAYL